MKQLSISEARELIKNKSTFDVEESFDLSKICTKYLKDETKDHWGREIVIRVLDNENKFPNETKELWYDIVEMSGLYPYLVPTESMTTSQLRYEYHKANFLENIYFHEEQLEISNQLQLGYSVILSAPTSFGKSLLIEDVIASKKYSNIVIIQPTLALLDETRKKLSKYRDSYNIVVSTSQSFKTNSNNLFLFTGERVVEYPKFPNIDFFVIDEFYKLSLDRDDERAITLNHAFIKLLKHTNKESPQNNAATCYLNDKLR